MSSGDDDQIAETAATVRRGTIIAAAGCGKTEQIARATGIPGGRRLILTHTHAGVDALRARLKKHGIPDDRFRIDTIASLSLRFAASFPRRSGLTTLQPNDKEWNTVYECAARLIESGAVSDVFGASYDRVLVDEYQDCTRPQHQIIRSVAGHLPTCIFGDPLQAIFDFKGQTPVDWDKDVFPVFPHAGQLTNPWRWKAQGNDALAEWLQTSRVRLENGQPVDLSNSPSCVSWRYLPADEKTQQERIQRFKAGLSACKSVQVSDNEKLVIIGDEANPTSRSKLAQQLSKFGFSTIEPVGCPDLFAIAKRIAKTQGYKRFEAVTEGAADCMTGINKAGLRKAVQSHVKGGGLGAKPFADLLPSCLQIVRSESYKPVLALLEALRRRPDTRLYRREMFFALCAAVRLMATDQSDTLADAVWQIQNRIRHSGRRLGRKSIGSTLLVKGLEFDHAVIIDANRLCRKNLYVALTRPVKSLTILSSSQQIIPAS
ncbi:MAG: UvrD-helicase domain-containing protein [Kiloniellales bacterium]|nr:UvrD-helicase domain-containing protein [Kiloniellales bacterium]